MPKPLKSWGIQAAIAAADDDVVDFQVDKIAAAQRAVDGESEQRQVAGLKWTPILRPGA